MFFFRIRWLWKFHIDRNQVQVPTMIDCYFRSQIHSIKTASLDPMKHMRLRSFMTLPTFMILMRVFEYFASAWLLHQCGFPGAGKYRLANYLLGGNQAPRHCNLTMYNVYIYICICTVCIKPSWSTKTIPKYQQSHQFPLWMVLNPYSILFQDLSKYWGPKVKMNQT